MVGYIYCLTIKIDNSRRIMHINSFLHNNSILTVNTFEGKIGLPYVLLPLAIEFATYYQLFFINLLSIIYIKFILRQTLFLVALVVVIMDLFQARVKFPLSQCFVHLLLPESLIQLFLLQ